VFIICMLLYPPCPRSSSTAYTRARARHSVHACLRSSGPSQRLIRSKLTSKALHFHLKCHSLETVTSRFMVTSHYRVVMELEDAG